jgi:hypothetical protein
MANTTVHGSSVDIFSLRRYGNKKTTDRCKAEYYKSSASRATEENYCASAEKDSHRSGQRGRQSGAKQTAQIIMKFSACFRVI